MIWYYTLIRLNSDYTVTEQMPQYILLEHGAVCPKNEQFKLKTRVRQLLKTVVRSVS